MYCLFQKILPEKIHPLQHMDTTNQHEQTHTHTHTPHTYTHTDITSYGHDELVEFAHPHDFTGFAPEPPIPQYLPVDVGYDNHFADVHEPHAHYGPPPPLTPYSHITNYIGTERKGK